MEQKWQAADFSAVFLRLALASSFLSSVADRFGLWGNFGQPYVAWGDFTRFVAYTAQLTSIAPTSFGPAMAWAATIAEIVLALALFIGLLTRTAAFLSGALLLLFGLGHDICPWHKSASKYLCLHRFCGCLSALELWPIQAQCGWIEALVSGSGSIPCRLRKLAFHDSADQRRVRARVPTLLASKARADRKILPLKLTNASELK